MSRIYVFITYWSFKSCLSVKQDKYVPRVFYYKIAFSFSRNSKKVECFSQKGLQGEE